MECKITIAEEEATLLTQGEAKFLSREGIEKATLIKDALGYLGDIGTFRKIERYDVYFNKYVVEVTLLHCKDMTQEMNRDSYIMFQLRVVNIKTDTTHYTGHFSTSLYKAMKEVKEAYPDGL